MKVINIHPTVFKSNYAVTKPDEKLVNDKNKITELSTLTPVYNVKTPQKYYDLGVSKFENGLSVYSYKLANGYKVNIIPMDGSPVTVKNYVNVGSMNETDDIKGISHFLEHMAFNGTNGENGYIKLNVGDSFKKIDLMGGWTNASTNYSITDYVNSTPNLEENDLEKQIKIIAAMTEDLALTKEMIEKEKGPVCSEINMILDNPNTILVDQSVRTLFNINSSADELVAGSTKHINNLTRDKVKAYYDKYYTPDNMNLVITGDVNPEEAIEIVSKNFHSTKHRNGNIYEEKLLPLNKTIRKDFISNKANSTGVMLAFAGPKTNDVYDKYILDILSDYLQYAEVGLTKEMKNINTSLDFGCEKISTNPNNPTMLYFALDTAEENSEKALKILFDKISILEAPSEDNLKILKEKSIQSYRNALEHSIVVNSIVGHSVIDGDFNSIGNYENIINSITTEDINNFIKKYFNLNKASITLVHPETSIENINNNYKEASSLSFKGRKNPVNMDKVKEVNLSNNYKIGFYETNNDNIKFNINLKYDIPPNTNSATMAVLDEIYNLGTMFKTENEFNDFNEKNNIKVSSRITPEKMVISGYSNQENFSKTIKESKDLLYLPRITQKEVDIAIDRLKDYINRSQDTASSIYSDYEVQFNPRLFSKKEILKNLDSVSVEDVKKLHHYILNNSMGYITINTPTANKKMEDISIEFFNDLQPVKPFEYKKANYYKRNETPIVLTKERTVSQADIMEVFNFEHNDTVKDHVLIEIINTLLSSSSIGLFNTLREKEHLAYSVYSNARTFGNSGEISCNILTTTDNKEIGEISYDNVQKSIDGFNRQITSLLNSEYTDDDLTSAKRALKATLLNKEGTRSKLRALNNGFNSKEGLDFENQLFNTIDTITRDDIDKFTKKVFSNNPIYSIVASKDTLEANKKYLESLKQ